MKHKERSSITINETKYEQIKPFIHKKDGMHHVLLLTAFAKLTTYQFECEEYVTLQLDNIITNMQKETYEILDLKISPIANPDILGTSAGYSIIIVYR